MTTWIVAAARDAAVVLAFEDLHWADPTSLGPMRARGRPVADHRDDAAGVPPAWGVIAP
jgi:hypothetical protein